MQLFARHLRNPREPALVKFTGQVKAQVCGHHFVVVGKRVQVQKRHPGVRHTETNSVWNVQKWTLPPVRDGDVPGACPLCMVPCLDTASHG